MAVVGSDQVTIVDLTDGYTVNMAPESYAFPAGTTNALAGSVGVLITALVGSTPIDASVTLSEVTAPAGITVTKDTNTSTPTLTMTIATSVTAPGVVVVPIHIADVTITKRFAFSLAKSGAGGTPGTPGVNAVNVIMGNDSQTLVTNSAGATTGTSVITIPFAGYAGTTRVAATVAVGTLPSGFTVGTNTAATTSADGSLTLNVASGSTLGGTAAGNINLTFTASGQAIPQLFSWSKALAGTAGSNGTNGADAIVLAVTSSNGTIFKNTSVATTLQAHVYKGGIEQTGAQITALGTINWYKDGSATSSGTGVTLVLDAGQVTNKATYEARLEA